MSALPGFLLGPLSKGLAESAVRSMSFHAWVEQWHDFYLMAGTAAVTLAGLLFVALSLHLDRLVEKNHEHLLALSRLTLTSYVLVLTASLFMLVPAMGHRITGVMLTILAVVGLISNAAYVRNTSHHDEGGFSRAQLRRRTMLPSIGYLLILSAGVGVLLGIPELLSQMIGATCMLLGNAAGTSWELLVNVAKHKRAAARE